MRVGSGLPFPIRIRIVKYFAHVNVVVALGSVSLNNWRLKIEIWNDQTEVKAKVGS